MKVDQKNTKILFITPSRIGDTVLCTGILDYFLKKYKNLKITVATPTITSTLFNDLPNLEEIVIWDKKPYKLHWLDLWLKTHNVVWDFVVDMRGSTFSLLLKSGKKIVWQQEKNSNSHKILQIKEILKKNKIDWLPDPKIWFNDKTKKTASKIIRDEEKVLALAPSANWIGKQWKIENFIDLANKFLKNFPDWKIAVFGASQEKNITDQLVNVLPKNNCIDTVDRGFSLLDIACLINRCKIFLGNDSGLMHISAALNVPTIGLFGPSNEAIYSPWQNKKCKFKHQFIRYHKNFSDFSNNIKVDYKTRSECYMDNISIAMAYDAISQALVTIE
jgi:heptosyltransferase-3